MDRIPQPDDQALAHLFNRLQRACGKAPFVLRLTLEVPREPVKGDEIAVFYDVLEATLLARPTPQDIDALKGWKDLRLIEYSINYKVRE